MYNTTKINLKIVESKGNTATVKITPLVKGFGYTIGNAIRRSLYSSMKGAAVTSVSIEGISHQFDTISGAKDDVLHILLALKQVRFKKSIEGPVVLELNEVGPKDVKASDIEKVAGVEVVNPELMITSLSDKKSKLTAKLTVNDGYGYVPANEAVSMPIGHVAMDANFSPIVNVVMEVNDTRVGADTNFDELTMTVMTDGTMDPVDAIREASKMLKGFFHKVETGEDFTEADEKELEEANSSESSMSTQTQADEVVLEELHLPTRTINALKKAGIKTLGDLADRSEDDLLRVRNLGEKSIREILSLLEKEGLK